MFERRLVTSGCSCTEHCWPTWAKYLGMHFREHVNVALSGADNATIARNAMAEARSGDIVVVLWTSFARFNTFDPDRDQRTDRPGDRHVIWNSGMTLQKNHTECDESGGWHHSGLISWNKSFLANSYHAIERFRNSLDSVKMLEMHSQLNGYQVWNFSMTDWFLGGIEAAPDPRLTIMHGRAQIKHFYLDQNLWQLREEILPITVTLPRGQDNHPTPRVHWSWLEQCVAPEMDITLNPEIGKIAQTDHDDLMTGRLVT